MGSYVYIRSEPGLYTVGFYKPDGAWNPESDHNNTAEAAKRVHYLNGGNDTLIKDLKKGIDKLIDSIDKLTKFLKTRM